jgi:hypothetical protein
MTGFSLKDILTPIRITKENFEENFEDYVKRIGSANLQDYNGFSNEPNEHRVLKRTLELLRDFQGINYVTDLINFLYDDFENISSSKNYGYRMDDILESLVMLVNSFRFIALFYVKKALIKKLTFLKQYSEYQEKYKHKRNHIILKPSIQKMHDSGEDNLTDRINKLFDDVVKNSNYDNFISIDSNEIDIFMYIDFLEIVVNSFTSLKNAKKIDLINKLTILRNTMKERDEEKEQQKLNDKLTILRNTMKEREQKQDVAEQEEQEEQEQKVEPLIKSRGGKSKRKRHHKRQTKRYIVKRSR